MWQLSNQNSFKIRYVMLKWEKNYFAAFARVLYQLIILRNVGMCNSA